MESREEAERLEEEGEEGWPMELEPEEKEIATATEGWGFLCYLALEGREVCGERSRFEMKLNSKKWKMDWQFHILRGASCRDVVSSMAVVVRFNKASTGR